MPKRGETTTRVSEGNGHLRGRSEGILPLARDPDLIGRIQQDIRALGLIGEEENGLLTYVKGTSRLLNKPLSVIYRGASSSGKNQVQQIPLRLMPAECKIDATAITGAALFRMEPDALKQKILIGGERKRVQDDSAADTTAALRQLLSEGRISKLLCVKNGGDWESKQIEVEGPVAYSESTTAKSIFAEDLNRMIQVTTNESEKQTRAVMLGIAETYSQDEKDVQAIIDRHHEFQGSLEYCDVRIPYAMTLAKKMPAGKIEMRRIIQQVLGTIEAVALLHQFQRERDGQGRLIATAEDYAVARKLLLRPLDHAMGLGQRGRHTYEKLWAKYKGKRFNTAAATTALDSGSRKVTLESLDDLVRLGILRCLEESKGNQSAWWGWTGKPLDELILPSVICVTALPRAKNRGGNAKTP